MYLNSSWRKDGLVLRGIVHFLFVLDTTQSFMIMDDAFFWFVYNFGDFTALFRFNLASIDGPVLGSTITFTVQLVYCWRLWILGKWKALPIVFALLALASCASGIAVGIQGVVKPSSHARTAEYLWLFTSAITDILIAASMAHLLMKYRTENSTRTTMEIVKRILFLTLETNAVTAAVAIVLAISFLVPSISPPKTNLYMSFGYILGKMYSNCFMFLLNQRMYYNAPGRITEETTTFGSRKPRGKVPNDCNCFSNQDTGQVSTIRFADVDEITEIEIGHPEKQACQGL